MLNTGTREQEICGLKGNHEVEVTELDISVFLIHGQSGQEREGCAWSFSQPYRALTDCKKSRTLAHPENANPGPPDSKLVEGCAGGILVECN